MNLNLEWGLILFVCATIFNVATSWTTVKLYLKFYREKVDKIEQKLNSIGNFDDVVRKYLFSHDGMTVYVPAAYCVKQHEKQDKLFEQLNEKQDAFAKQLNGKIDAIVDILVNRK